jgi:maltose O-acetyltransferase
MVWILVNFLQSSFLLPARLRMLLLRMSGVEVQSGARISGGVFLGSSRHVFGIDSFVNIHCFLDGNESICLGEGVHIGPYVRILTGTHTVNEGVFRRRGSSQDVHLPVRVERGAWVGAGVIILPGVTVAEGCVIAAGAVLTESTQPNGLYGGVPAKRIRDLPV